MRLNPMTVSAPNMHWTTAASVVDKSPPRATSVVYLSLSVITLGRRGKGVSARLAGTIMGLLQSSSGLRTRKGATR